MAAGKFVCKRLLLITRRFSWMSEIILSWGDSLVVCWPVISGLSVVATSHDSPRMPTAEKERIKGVSAGLRRCHGSTQYKIPQSWPPK